MSIFILLVKNTKREIIMDKFTEQDIQDLDVELKVGILGTVKEPSR